MKTKEKDPKKVAAGRKGGRLSGNNFKRNIEGARLAGKKSAWARGEKLLADFPLGLIDPDTQKETYVFPDNNADRRKKR